MKLRARFRCTRLHFLYSCKENEAKESTRGLRPSTPAEQSSACTALRQPYICKPRWNPFGEPSQTQRLTAFQTHGKVRFCPPGKNPLTSHAVRCYKCCLGLPLAFCAAFRCSLRWRFTTRLFVHVFLPFGFFDKLCFKHFV